MSNAGCMRWLDLEADWLRANRNCYFSLDDERGVQLFEQHLRTSGIRFVKQIQPGVPAVVFSRDASSDEAPIAA